MRRTLLALALVASLPGCATKYTSISGALKLGATPEENYQRGVAEMEAKHWPEALRFFEYVKAKYPFSNVSLLSDLRLSDIKFLQGRFAEAADSYDQFTKDHPSSDQVEYAQFRSGLSHIKAAPPDFFMFPPVYEKDQRETEKGVAALREFIQTHPGSQYLAEAQKALEQGERLLASREMAVGDYYFKRGYWAGAAGRYKGLAESYPATPLAEPAELKLAQAYLRMDEKHQARQALQRFLTQHPESARRPEAERLLESLR